MQLVVEGHETAAKEAVNAPTGLGVLSATQLVPCQESARVFSPGAFWPTATQTELAGQDAATSELALGTRIVGPGVTAQAVPTRDSVRVR
jgi:hypothetical protein